MKKKLEEEQAKAAEEEERLRKEEEARLAEEAKGKKKGAKPQVKKAGQAQFEEAPTAPVIESFEKRTEREKAAVNEQLEELRSKIDAYQSKVKLCHRQCIKIEKEGEGVQIDLKTKQDDRKFLRNALEERADTILGPKKAYVLVSVKKNDNDDDVTEEVTLDGACIRTPEEDKVWDEN